MLCPDDFLDAITFEHGPQQLLTRAILKAVGAAVDRGIALEFGSFDELATLDSMGLDGWRPLPTCFCNYIGRVNAHNGFVIIGRNANREPVVALAARYLSWQHHFDFDNEVESLRFFYASPERDVAPGERCDNRARYTGTLQGRLMHVGEIWIHPSIFARQLDRVIPRLGRALALTWWDIDQAFGLISEENVGEPSDKLADWTNAMGLVIHKNSPGYPGEETRLMLVRMTREEILDDLFAFVMESADDTGSGTGRVVA